MASTLPPLSVELEELLTDIAKDPKAKLLRVDPRKLARGLGPGRHDASPMQAGLVAAERELLARYREEVASLLVAEFRALLESDPKQRSMPHRRQRTEAERRASLRAIECAVDESRGGLSREASAIGLLHQCQLGLDSSLRSKLRLVGAALRLIDKPAIHVWMSHAFIAAGHHGSALRCASHAASVASDPGVLGPALEASGIALDEVGDPNASLSLFGRVIELYQRCGWYRRIGMECGMSALVVSLELGSNQVSETIARLVVDCWKDHPESPAAVGATLHRYRSNGWNPAPAFRRRVSELPNDRCGVIKEVMNASL